MISITPFFHVYHKYVFIMANINKIRLSGTTYSIQDLNATKTVELTQAEYDELSPKDPNTFYVITDATAGDLSNYYTKTETDGLLDTKLDVTAYTPTDLSNYYTKSETSGATEISTALASKADTATTYTKTETDNAITAATSTKQDTLVSGTNIKTINNESILGEGNITIQGGGSSYTAGDGIDITNDVISVTGKVDTSTYNTYTAATDTALASKQTTLTAGTGISIVDNVISATGGGSGGGGKAISGGTNISITTGETADTINCTLNLENGTNSQSGGIKLKSDVAGNIVSGRDACAFGGGNIVGGTNSFVTGYYNTGDTSSAFISGNSNKTTNKMEVLFGMLALSNGSQSSDLNGNSGCTLFAVGNGDWISSTRHNAFEIRQNGDIYIPDTNDTSTTNDYEKPMIKLQDALGGGGGSSYTAGDGINITNDVISVTGKVDTSAFTAHTADTVIHVTSDEKAAWNAKSDFSGDYNDLANKPTIPTVPTSNTAFTNDAGYITSSALNGYATTGDVQTATADMATKTWVGQQGYLTEHQSLSNYYTKSETSGATEISTALNAKADTATTYTKAEVDTELASKQDTLVSGTNIKTINNESILGSGNITIQGGGSVDQTIISGSTNAVAGGAVYTQLDGLKLKKITQSAYDALSPNYDANTLYVING